MKLKPVQVLEIPVLQGPPGEKGEKGDKGDPGPPGRDGISIQGPMGPSGRDGKDGATPDMGELESAYKRLQEELEGIRIQLKKTRPGSAGAAGGQHFVGGGDFVEEIVVTMDGGGSVLTTGDTRTYYTVPYAGEIAEWFLTGDPSGSIVIDIWRARGAIPTSSDTITGTAKPQLSSQALASSRSLSGWNRRFAEGDTLGFEIESCSTITKSILTLKIQKT